MTREARGVLMQRLVWWIIGLLLALGLMPVVAQVVETAPPSSPIRTGGILEMLVSGQAQTVLAVGVAALAWVTLRQWKQSREDLLAWRESEKERTDKVANVLEANTKTFAEQGEAIKSGLSALSAAIKEHIPTK